MQYLKFKKQYLSYKEGSVVPSRDTETTNRLVGIGVAVEIDKKEYDKLKQEVSSEIAEALAKSKKKEKDCDGDCDDDCEDCKGSANKETKTTRTTRSKK